MSWLSGTTDKVALAEPKLFGQDPAGVPTNEAAQPLPWFAGTRLLGIRLISNPFNEVYEPVKQKAGKKKVISGYNYFASFAALIAQGRCDRLTEILIDDEVVWSGTVNREGDSALITIEGRGQVHLYWGTSTQGIDEYLAEAGEDHSAMRDACYAVFIRYFCGYQIDHPTKIQFRLSRWPSRGWMDGSKMAIGMDCNAVYAFADFWQDPLTSVGMRDNFLDLPSWTAAAAKVYSEGIGISPFFNQAISIEQARAKFLEYVGGYLYNTVTGKIGLKLSRPLDADVALITTEDLWEKPSYQADGWDTVVTDLTIKFINADRHYKEDSFCRPNSAVRFIVGESNPKTVDRSWITVPSTALQMWAIMSRAAAIPKIKGTLIMKSASAAELLPGSLFLFCYPSQSLNLLCRVIIRKLPAPGSDRVEIPFESDHSHLQDTHTIITEEPYTPPVAREIDPIIHQLALELPYGVLGDVYAEGATFLAARPNGVTTRFAAHRKKADGSFESVFTSPSFCNRGVLLDRYEVTSTFDEAIGMRIKLDAPDRTLPNVPLLDAFLNEWLLFVGGEIISMFGATLLGAGEYRVYGIRGRYDTEARMHLAASECFLIDRSLIDTYLVPGGATEQFFKLQPFVFGTGLDLSEADEITMQCGSRGLRPWAPKNFRAFGILDPVYETGDDIEFSWTNTVPDPSGEDVPITKMQFTLGEAQYGYLTFAAGVSSYTLTNANLLAILASVSLPETTFTVRLFHQRGDYRSTHFAELTVTKI